MIAQPLCPGDEIRIIAPARSLHGLNQTVFDHAVAFLSNQGFLVSFSKNCREIDESHSSSIKARLDDLHDAFADQNVKAILACNGGSNSNQLLEHLDYDLIKNNPKILCGFSDICTLLNAIHAKTGLVTYHGPVLAFLGYNDAIDNIDYTLNYFRACLVHQQNYLIQPSEQAKAYEVIQEGSFEGEIVGGNLCTLNLLQGTAYMPDLENKILFLEDSNAMGDYFVPEFDRNLQSLVQTKGFNNVGGIVFGRFGDSCKMDVAAIKKVVATKKQLENIPIVFNVDFGHELPLATFPIGGTARLQAIGASVSLEILKPQ